MTAPGSLWRRAPLWRFCLLSGALLTLLFCLFPPVLQKETKTAVPPLAASHATYTPAPRVTQDATPPAPQAAAEPVPAPSPKSASPVVAQAAIANPVAPPVRAAPPAPQAVHPPPAAPIVPLPRPPVAQPPVTQPLSAAPKTGELSLAPPANLGAKPAADPLHDQVFSGSIAIRGFKLPLPPGSWTMLANSVLTIPNSNGMGYFLGRIEHKKLVGAVIVYAFRSNLTPGAGFELFGGCADSSLIYVANEGATAFDRQACWVVRTYFTPPWQQWTDRSLKLPNLTRAAAGDMAAKGVTYPQDFVAVEFYRSEKWGLVDATYLFSPESEGIKSNAVATFPETDWRPTSIQRFPDKVAYAGKIREWGVSFWPRVKGAFAAGE